MSKRHPKYKIKKGDTISSITIQFGIEEDVWKRYHNNSCPLSDVVQVGLPSHLVELFLIPELWDKEGELNRLEENMTNTNQVYQQVSFGYDNALIMKFCPDILTYKVALFIKNGSKENRIEFNVSIRWCAKDDQVFTVEINKLFDTYRINKQIPDLVADELALKAGSALYPLELLITRKDGIVSINNIEDIQKRWVKIKEDILNYKEGAIVEKYLSLNEKSLKDGDILLNSLQNDWFLHAYFNKIYITYSQGYSINNPINVPFIFDTEGVEYQVQHTINENLDKDGYINVSLKGEVSDTRSIIDLVNKLDYNRYASESPLVGEYNALYTINPEYNTIEEIRLNTKLDLEYQKMIDIHIAKIKR